MTNKTALILGANSDIAKSLIYIFAENKLNLILTARNLDQIKTLKSDLEIKFDIKVQNVNFDILNTEGHLSFYKSLDITPDVVVDAIGVLGNQKKAFESFEYSKNIIDSNLTSHISILDIIANDMKDKNSKLEDKKEYSIIGIGSVAGDAGRPDNYTYGAAKAGYSIYLSGLRTFLKKYNIHVLTVKPGVIATKMTADLSFPSLIVAKPEKVAKAIFKAYKKSKAVIYTPKYWKIIMGVIKFLPERVFVKVFSVK